MAENTSAKVQETKEAVASELVNAASQAQAIVIEYGPVSDTDADAPGEGDGGDPAGDKGQAAALAVRAESERDHRELQDNSGSDTEKGWIETDAGQDKDKSATIPAPTTSTTDQSNTGNAPTATPTATATATPTATQTATPTPSKSSPSETTCIVKRYSLEEIGMSETESEKTVNVTQKVKKVKDKVPKVKPLPVKMDPEAEAREILEKFLFRLYGDYNKSVLSVDYKKRIVAYLQGQLPIAEQIPQLKSHVNLNQYVLVDADKVSNNFITSTPSGDRDRSIVMDNSDPDGQSEKQTEQILMRPHVKTKELVFAPSQREMYDLIVQCHLSSEEPGVHEGLEYTHKLLQVKYGCVPKQAVQKYISMCRECQMRRKHIMRQKMPKQQEKQKTEEVKTTEDEGDKEAENEQGTAIKSKRKRGQRRTEEELRELEEQKQKRMAERKAASERRKREREERQLRKQRVEEKRKEPLRKRKLRPKEDDLIEAKKRRAEEKKMRAEEKKRNAEERKRLKALEAEVKRLERENERKGVAAATDSSDEEEQEEEEAIAVIESPVKRMQKGKGVVAKKSPVKRGKKSERATAATKRSPAKRKASANETTTRKKVKVTETKAKAKPKKSRVSPTSLVQYVILPGDVFHAEGFTTNQAVVQACHARTAVLQLFKDDDNVIKYTSDFDAMHTEILETEDEEEMEVISDALKGKNIDHILWMKSDTNMATCIATKPYPKNKVQRHFKDLTQFLME